MTVEIGDEVVLVTPWGAKYDGKVIAYDPKDGKHLVRWCALKTVGRYRSPRSTWHHIVDDDKPDETG